MLDTTLWILSLADKRSTPFGDVHSRLRTGAVFSPDGRSVAYLDNSSGILNVWSKPLDGGAAKQLTNFKSEFVSSFSISRDGKIAAYRFSATRDIVLIKGFR